MSLLLFAARRKRTTIASILAKYSGSHHWDFGVSADKVAAGASMTAAQFLAAYPLHHLYQDADGTTPAFLPTHPVGLCLDQPSGSVVLGAEMVTNGGPFTATTGWAASSFGGTLAAVDGELQVTSTDANSRGLFSFATTVGKSYLITGSVRKVSGTVDAAFGYSTSLVSGGSFIPLVSTSRQRSPRLPRQPVNDHETQRFDRYTIALCV
jgi:hypothetical protein